MVPAGANLGISRGLSKNVDFQKTQKTWTLKKRGLSRGLSKNQNFVYLFFRSTKLIFWALSNHYKDRNLNKFSAPQASFLNKAKNSVRAPLKISKDWRPRRF